MISTFVWIISISMLALMALAYVNNQQQARRQKRKDHLEERRERFYNELTGKQENDTDKEEP